MSSDSEALGEARPLIYVPPAKTLQLINSRTSRYHFGMSYSENYEDPYGHNLNRMKNMFNFAWQSFDKTIRPNAVSVELIQLAREELSKKIAAHYQARSFKGVTESDSAMGYLGVHIRRGDRLPAWHVYGQMYIPLTDYVDAVVESWTRLGLEVSPDDKLVQPFVYIASDSPLWRRTSKHSELQALASPGEYVQNDFMKLDPSNRLQATRGMVVDFALLSGAWSNDGDLIPDGTVCTVSSVVCKLAAVGLGWKRAFGLVDEMGYIEKETRRWIDVDLKGRVVPVWEAFQAY
ncbi:hypothetical protein B0H10DRAFT_2064437 [Mycena sp. CBHHK59/15]|nr:hypothetical protein B0H10DRAFT_2064437 [Mycena sp. CBHHK59/15]